MNSLIIDLQYFANVYWYKKAYNYKYVYLSVYEKHRKMSFRNRLLIAGADGPLRLTVPIVDGRNERQLYKEVKLVPGRWATEHFRAIVSCYNRSPWFEYYRDELAVLYSRQFSYLFDWNLACHEFAVRHLKCSTQFERLGSPAPEQTNPPRIIENAVNSFTPATLETADEQASKLGSYTQVFHEKTGFLAALSILDLLFCEGPSASNRLAPPEFGDL